MDIALRRFAAGNAIAAGTLAAVDTTRLRYLTKLIAALPGQTQNSARRLARMEYALFVDCQVLWPENPPETLLKADGSFKRLT